MSRKIRNPLTEPKLPETADFAPVATQEMLGDSLPPLNMTNGNVATEHTNGLPVVEEQDTPAGDKRPKRPSEVFYLIIGTSKDETAIDVLGMFSTGGRARKGLDAMRMAVARSYKSVQVVQCRDRTAA